MSSVSVIEIEKCGNIKELKIKSFDETELYKKGGFKTPIDFKEHTSWENITVNNINYNIHVYGKIVGRANQENKYEFPPPIDNTLFFGSCILVNKVNNTPQNLSSKEWESIYKQLYGGFEDLDTDVSDESEDSDDNLPKTKSGYVKDDFVVDDDYEEHVNDSLSDVPKIKRKSKQTNTVPPKTQVRSKPPVVFNEYDTEEDTVYSNDIELEEEEYL